MKVLLVTHGGEFSSMSIYAKRLASGLSEKIQVDLFNLGKLYTNLNPTEWLDLKFEEEIINNRVEIKKVYSNFIKSIRRSYDIIHITTQRFGFLAEDPLRDIVTFHDIIPFSTKIVYPQLYKIYTRSLSSKVLNTFFKLNTVKLAKRGFHIISDSGYTKKMLMQKFKFAENKINILGVPICLPTNIPEKNDARQTLGLPLNKKILLTITSKEARKNLNFIENVIENLDDNYLYCVVGGQSNLLQYKNSKKNFLMFEKLTWEQIVNLYASTDFYVSPSYEEGFDLPVIEAASYGKRLLLSDIPVHRELIGGLGEYFDPKDNDSLLALLRNNIYQVTSDYSNELADLSRRFDKSTVAINILKYYDQVLQNK